MSTTTVPLTLPETPPEIKRYQRQKLLAHLASAVLGLAFLLILTMVVSPLLDPWLRAWLGDGPWLRLLAMAVIVGVGVKHGTVPFTT